MHKEHALKGRKQSPAHAAAKARKCLPGCDCKRHTSQKTDEVRGKHRENTKKKWEEGLWEGRADKTAATRAAWSDEKRAEVSRNMSEAKRKEWAEKGPDRNSVPGHLRSRVSKQELSLVPYLEALGYQHNNAEHYGTDQREKMTFIGRKVPDFIDKPGRRVFEYFGLYWHKPADEQHTIEFYALRGWQCTVLWESDLFTFLADHEPLVTPEQHQHAWKVAHINNGYRKPRE